MPGIKYKAFSIVFFVFVTCSVLGQVSNKKTLTELDYAKWSTMEIKGSSESGNWICYNLLYENGNDTLVIRNKYATKVHSFPKGSEGTFGNDRWFACRLPEDKLWIVDLATGRYEIIHDVGKFEFSNDGKTLVVLQNNKTLSISYLGQTFAKICNVNDFVTNPTKTAMVYTIEKEKTSLHYCPFDGNEESFKKIVADEGLNYLDVSWSKTEKTFAFRKVYSDQSDSRNGHNLFLYQLDTDTLYTLDFSLPENAKIASRSIQVSDDGSSVFFYTKLTGNDNSKTVVQIWNGNDTWTYRQKEVGLRHLNNYCYVWQPKNNETLQLTNDENSHIVMSGDQKYAVMYNPVGESAEFSLGNKISCSIKNISELQNGEPIRKNVFTCDEITPSNGGQYLLYRVDEEWFVYKFCDGISFSLSDIFPNRIPDQSSDRSGKKANFQIAGWTKDDKEVVVYDEYDIWFIDLEKQTSRRITMGREKGIVYRIIMPSGQTNKNANFDEFTYPLIPLENGIYLSKKDKVSKNSGYVYFKNSEKTLAFENKTFEELHYNQVSKTVYFTKEDFNMPPELIAYELLTGKQKTIFKSNHQHSNYKWGKSELIEYKNTDGTALQGALFYPSEYEAGKKYPMVVWIYEKLSNHVHNYVNPSLRNGGSVNIANLTSQGYFVLYPDIKYTKDQVGVSATNCVVNATQAIIDKGLVDNKRIALVGHSFGGYEAAYISTQTDLFATVIVGAGVSNLVSSYLSIGWNNGRPESWRYENDQWRMTKSLYDNMDSYLQNSPVMHAKNVSVPILIWAGEQDKQVHYFQSVEYYNALRRLGKKEVMLIYPNNRHRLTEKASEEDFEHRLQQWFDAFLKGKPATDWIANGIK
ncbi:alpha/beta hydrolase family protein [Flavobacterium sp.]